MWLYYFYKVGIVYYGTGSNLRIKRKKLPNKENYNQWRNKSLTILLPRIKQIQLTSGNNSPTDMVWIFIA